MPSLLIRLIKARELSLILLLAAYVLLVASLNPEFIAAGTLSLLIKTSVILLVLAIGQSFVLFTSNIDVSVGSIMGLSSAICGVLLSSGYPVGTVIPTVLASGAIIGLFNGIGVSFFRIPSIIMTLGMLGIIRGTMMIYTKGMWIEDIPNFYKKWAITKFMGINLTVWCALLLVIITHFYLTKTRFGRYFFAVGDNEEGARLVGIPIRRVQLLAFVFSGLSASMAGLVFVMNIGFVPNQTGSGMELQVIAAAVLGGVSLSGGLGSVAGAGLGAIFFTVMNTSLIYMKIPAYWNNAISGFLLLLIVVGDSKFQHYLKRQLFAEKGGAINGEQKEST